MENYDSGYAEDDHRKIIFIAIAAITALAMIAIVGNYLMKKKGDDPSVVVSASPTPNIFVCGIGTARDIDNNIYSTVKIGDQCWLKENLKVTKNPEGEEIKRYCYDNKVSNCDTEGGLYDWDTAMNGSKKRGAQGICPNGWYIPGDSEWHILERDLASGFCSSLRTEASCDPAGTKLKKGGDIGFDAILAGYFRDSSGSFHGQGTNAFFWSSMESGDIAWDRNLSLNASAVYRNLDFKKVGFSVRCLKD